MRKVLVFLGLLAVCGGALGWDWWRQKTVAQGPAAAVPVLRDAATWKAMEGLVNPNARVTVVHFWATWCQPCMVEMPKMLAALQQVPQGVAVTLVSLDDPAPEGFYKDHKVVAVTVARDTVSWVNDGAQRRAKALLKKVMLPTTLVVDGRGEVLQQVDGPLDWASFLKELSRD